MDRGTNGFACGPVWVPPAAEKLLEEAVSTWTWVTGAGENGRIHDGVGLMGLKTKRTALGRVGLASSGPRGGELFTHVVDLWAASVDKRVASDTAYMPGKPSGVVCRIVSGSMIG